MGTNINHEVSHKVLGFCRQKAEGKFKEGLIFREKIGEVTHLICTLS